MSFNKIKDKIKNLLLNKKEEEENVNEGAYWKMLGMNIPLSFPLLQETVKDRTEFSSVVRGAEDLLEQDFKRFGIKFKVIDPVYKNNLNGNIGSMTVVVDDNDKVTAKFHRRDDNGLWDGMSKKFPEEDTTGKYIDEICFIIM